MKKPVVLFCVFVCLFAQAEYGWGQSQGRNNSGNGPSALNFADSAFSDMEKAFNTVESETTPQDAYYLGRAVAANILAAYKPYVRNQGLTRYLNRICQTLVINSSQPVLFNGYSVIILDSPEFNAFATPGGHIFITKGLAEAAASEDMLASVIAHELAHIMLKHGIKLIEDMDIANEAETAANRASDLASNPAAARRLMLYRNSVAQILDTMMKNGYSKPQEFEADITAAQLLAASGYDPKALLEILKILQQVQNSQQGGFNTTHPSPAERIANVQETVNRYRITDTSAYRTKRFINK